MAPSVQAERNSASSSLSPSHALDKNASGAGASTVTKKIVGQDPEEKGEDKSTVVLAEADLATALDSWNAVVELVPMWHEVFFAQLFQHSPNAKHRFFTYEDGNTWNEKHRARVGQAVGDVIGSLAHYDGVISKLTALGRRHMGYGLHEEHFDLFVDAFLWTIGAGLGDSWDHSIKRAWVQCMPFVLAPLRIGLVAERSSNSQYDTSQGPVTLELWVPLPGRRLRPISVSMV